MCAVLVQAVCGETDEDVAYDLATLLTEARVISELRRLDFGVADTRSYLDEGWSRDESAADGTSFVWSTGESSSLRLFLAQRRDVQLSFRCWTFQYPEAPPQQVTVEVIRTIPTSRAGNTIANRLTASRSARWNS